MTRHRNPNSETSAPHDTGTNHTRPSFTWNQVTDQRATSTACRNPIRPIPRTNQIRPLRCFPLVFRQSRRAGSPCRYRLQAAGSSPHNPLYETATAMIAQSPASPHGRSGAAARHNFLLAVFASRNSRRDTFAGRSGTKQTTGSGCVPNAVLGNCCPRPRRRRAPASTRPIPRSWPSPRSTVTWC